MLFMKSIVWYFKFENVSNAKSIKTDQKDVDRKEIASVHNKIYCDILKQYTLKTTRV